MRRGSRIWMRAAGLALLALSLSAAAQAQSRTVALTFDDLPGTDSQDAWDLAAINDAILASLDRHRAPATGFVIGRLVERVENGSDLLRRWTAHGHDLGNHTFSHDDLNRQTVEAFAEEITRAEATFRPLLPAGRTGPLFMRFPFLHSGDTPGKEAGVAAFLKTRGYENAVCTISNSDWVFAGAYARALGRGDSASAAKLRDEYVAHTGRMIDYYVGLHRRVFGRETPHVMLLHVNRLNADALDTLVDTFEKRLFRFVSLREAMADRAYRTPDAVATQDGPLWGYRWARSLGVAVDKADEPKPSAWIEAYGR